MLHENEPQHLSAHDYTNFSHNKESQSENPGSCPENVLFPYLLGCDII